MALATLDVMLNPPFCFMSKLLGNKQCLVASLSEVSWNVFPMLSESHSPMLIPCLCQSIQFIEKKKL